MIKLHLFLCFVALLFLLSDYKAFQVGKKIIRNRLSVIDFLICRFGQFLPLNIMLLHSESFILIQSDTDKEIEIKERAV